MMKCRAWIIFLLSLSALLGFAYWQMQFLAAPESADPQMPASWETAPPLSLTLAPPAVIQGEPVLIRVHGVALPAIEKLTFEGKDLPLFEHAGQPAALAAISLSHSPGRFPLVLTTADGRRHEEPLSIRERQQVSAGFQIPESFGGNTRAGAERLEANLEADTAILNAITQAVTPEKLWEGPFRYPLDGSITITDTYGYSRETGSVSLSHNGTDFRASIGTPVYAMNSGQVAYAGTFRNYGNSVIIDHGQGLMTMYLHLSETKALLGQRVAKSELIGLSGNTGYSLGPHLHLSVRIHGLSIDPERFLELLGEKESPQESL